MKVCFISNLYYPFIVGGAEISVQRIAEKMVQEGHDVFVITTNIKRGRSEEKINGVKVYRLGLANVYSPYSSTKKPYYLKSLYWLLNFWNPYSYIAIKEILKAEFPDIVHINNYRGLSLAVFSVVKDLNLPLVFTARDYSTICLKTNLLNSEGKVCKAPSKLCRLHNNIVKSIIQNKPDVVITASKFVIHKLKENHIFESTRCVVLPNAIDLGEILSSEKDYNTIDILYVGSLSKHKGVEILVNAFKDLQSTNAVLHIVGKGSYVEHLKKISNGDRRIVFHGFLQGSDLSDLYRKANLTIVPSIWYEPFGLTIIESFKHGTPVLGSKIGGIQEIIEEGRNGLLFEPGNVLELREKLEHLIKSPSELAKLEAGAFLDVHQYDLSVHVSKLEDVYKMCTGIANKSSMTVTK